ncbi:tetratricopeptide repeat protein [Ureibacillus manganicus]|uniref:Tetratricopeptide repeat protein n=1 Tax=Ureibacillus manganicus DSM 26584 TaxID=1384049 RepID=A0A0A3HTC9_9BACL|nr:hypothetical protein [Ureibacillus manganicus]KGR73548.1 hypothetical protein CD29_19720 [Ureibacillus manganicus DSM 26584]
MEKESINFLQKSIKTYQGFKNSITKRIIDSSDVVYENQFLDDGTIKVMIDQLKKDYSSIQKELEILFSVNDSELFNQYLYEQQEVKYLIAFYASNNPQNIDYCLELIDNINIDFKDCLLAIKDFEQNNYKSSFLRFYNYFSQNRKLLEHYIINKYYGILLYKEMQYDQAIIFLQKAVEKRPEDKDLHIILKEIYEKKGLLIESGIEESILTILSGVK